MITKESLTIELNSILNSSDYKECEIWKESQESLFAPIPEKWEKMYFRAIELSDQVVKLKYKML